MRTLAAVLLLLSLPASLPAQAGGWEDRIEVRQDTAVFTLWAWLTLMDTATDRTPWLPAKHHVRQALERRLPAAYRDSLAAVHARHAGHMLGYHATMLALHVTPPPVMRFDPAVLRHYQAGALDTAYLRLLQRLGDDLLPLLEAFHGRAELATLLQECAQWYEPAVAAYGEGTRGVVRAALGYLRNDGSALAEMQRVIIIPNLIGPPGTAMGPRHGDVLYDVETPRAEDGPPTFTAHEYLHQLVRPLLQPPAARARALQIATAVGPRLEGTRAGQYYPEPADYFEESLVRTLDLTARYGPGVGYDNERLKQLLAAQHDYGFFLVNPLRDALAAYEASAVPFAEFFPELLERVALALSLPPDQLAR